MDSSLNDGQIRLVAALSYEPVSLAFGTSGRRGDVVDLSQIEIYINVRADLDHLFSLPPSEGGIKPGQRFFYACDLRPSSTGRVVEQGGRGELAQTVAVAIRDAGLVPVFLGAIPTPALTAYGLANGCGSIMVTGSHIPFERNGYKTNSARGELRKEDEAPIATHVAQWRARLYDETVAASRFDTNGMLKERPAALPVVDDSAQRAYLDRFRAFFAADCLRGRKVLVYQHSAVGRDLLAEMLESLGAAVRVVGRSEVFVPIDTEAIDGVTLETIRQLAAQASADGTHYDALVSTDGDSDRPLIVGLDYDVAGRCSARFWGGDLVGMLTAEYLAPDAVVVPISCNDAIDRGPLASKLRAKTRIGSPYVIAGMEAALAAGRHRVCGWEANGGFFTASTVERGGRTLPALPTRDAFLPILAVLVTMGDRKLGLNALFETLPRRFSCAGLLRRLPRAASLLIVAALSPAPEDADAGTGQGRIAARVANFFTAADGFGVPTSLDYTDGVRITFDNGDIAHVRPSGNADELRIYAVADSQARADAIVAAAVAERDGILRRLAVAFAEPSTTPDAPTDDAGAIQV